MTYLVLARKYRPRSFDTLIGQDHVVRALAHALDSQRLHHAWLFTGTRGVGKTTLSRILAKSLNCAAGITSTPCGVCPACIEIDAGRYIDYVELDAASNRGVDEMAQLLEQAVYAPGAGRFKVYMIDEVHMLTGHAFNAMLKTLEEPPPHVKFILATTDPQKIPVTVLSRCLQFNLKQMPPEAIVDHLTQVLAEENIAGEASALRLLARAAGGSMRDALSLTDQAIAYCAGQVTEDAVRGMLGTIDQRHLVHLLRALAAGRADAVLQVADDLAARGLSYAGALADVASLLARVAVAQRVPSALDDIDPLAADITELAGELHPDLIQLFYSVAVHSRTELALAPDEYAGFVMACLRMLSLVAQAGPDCGAKVQAPPWDNNAAPTQAPAASALASLQPPAVIHPYVALAQSTTPGSSEIPVASPPHGASSESTFDVQPTYVAPAHDGPSGLNEMMADEAQADHASGYVSDHDDDFETVFGLEANGAARMSLVGAATLAPTSPVRAMRPPPPRLTDMTAEQWPALAAALPVTGLAAELARQCEWLGAADGCVRVRVAVRTLADSASRLRLETVLCEHFGQSLRIEVSVGATSDATAHAVAESVRVANQLGAEEAVAADPFVQTLVADFGAHVVPQSIRHVEQDSRA